MDPFNGEPKEEEDEFEDRFEEEEEDGLREEGSGGELVWNEWEKDGLREEGSGGELVWSEWEEDGFQVEQEDWQEEEEYSEDGLQVEQQDWQEEEEYSEDGLQQEQQDWSRQEELERGDWGDDHYEDSWKHYGDFEQAKVEASIRNRWLIIHLQSEEEYYSRDFDFWGDRNLTQVISEKFLLWQNFDFSVEGMKVRCFYKLETIPSILLIDPITGQKMWSPSGFYSRLEDLLDELVTFYDRSPHEAIEAPWVKVQEQEEEIPAVATEEEAPSVAIVSYPPLPEEEPKHGCRIVVRLPNGQRLVRNFLDTDPIQVLWSFCSSLLNDETETYECGFQLVLAIPGAVEYLNYEMKLSLGESGWANSVISVRFLED
ncbi:hypothetical protein MRB53_022008 [Persea americana]|uniref:Uncharacterized protein n=1 Tax=Persea americana TaxID=3435 RepID=A0ACC2L5Z6_PERAE|nr:hypothetical protein MRB53_022008 [Persea americana]